MPSQPLPSRGRIPVRGRIRRTASRRAPPAPARTAYTTTVAIGQQPVAVAVNATTNKIYVANNRDNTVKVIDGATNATTTVPVGQQPVAVAVSEATNLV